MTHILAEFCSVRRCGPLEVVMVHAMTLSGEPVAFLFLKVYLLCSFLQRWLALGGNLLSIISDVTTSTTEIASITTQQGGNSSNFSFDVRELIIPWL